MVKEAQPRGKTFLQRLGPGLITGASDDDPSGIATYSQAGARFGFGLLWAIPFTFPLLASIQEISARIGRITGHGIAGNIRRHYSPWLLYPIVFLLLVANTINLGADIGAMGDALKLLIGGPGWLYCVGFALVCLLLEIFVLYQSYAKLLKWLTLVLFSYIVAAFVAHPPWKSALRATVLPSISLKGDQLATLIALLGTTISPYLFFWQSSMEIEEIHRNHDDQALRKAPRQAREQLTRIRLDTYVGMGLSSTIAYFVVLTTAATLNAKNPGQNIETSAQAAEALRPLAGNFAFALFALGIIGTGLMAVPALAGSAAYAVGEALRWRTGLDRKPYQAKGFYAVIATATLLGLSINFPVVQRVIHMTPIQALFWAAVINGVSAVPIMVVMMLMCHNKAVLGPFVRISKPLKCMGWLATAAMFLAAAGMLLTWKR